LLGDIVWVWLNGAATLGFGLIPQPMIKGPLVAQRRWLVGPMRVDQAVERRARLTEINDGCEQSQRLAMCVPGALVAGILFRDLIAGQFAPPALIDGARLHPQHDCEYKQGTGNGGSILSIFAHDEPPILSTREHARGLQWRRCSDGFAETLYDTP
jgi:hypothetical protein